MQKKPEKKNKKYGKRHLYNNQTNIITERVAYPQMLMSVGQASKKYASGHSYKQKYSALLSFRGGGGASRDNAADCEVRQKPTADDERTAKLDQRGNSRLIFHFD